MRLKDFKDARYNVGVGNADYEGALTYQEEYYRVHCPELVYKELDRQESSPSGALSDLWNEAVEGLRFKREIKMKMFPEFATEERQVHRKHAVESEHDVRFVLSMYNLREVDLYPEVGDHVIYRMADYEIIRVYVDPQHLWLHTNAPLYVSAMANLYRPGDRRMPSGRIT
jgi:hypothetical protein